MSSDDDDDNDHHSDFLTTPTRSPQQHHHHHHHDTLASNPSQSRSSVFGTGNPKWRVEEKEDPSRYVRWTAYDKPVEFPTAVQALVTRRGWTNPWNPASPLGKLAEAKRERVALRRGEAESLAITAEQARRLWAIKSDATLAEQIGRESTSILGREELIDQLLARDEANAALSAECAQLRHDMSLMTEALRQVVEAQETAARVPTPRTSTKKAENTTKAAAGGGGGENVDAKNSASKKNTAAAAAAAADDAAATMRAWRAKAMSSFVQKWNSMAMFPAFKGWKTKVQAFVRARVILKRAVSRMERRTLAAAGSSSLHPFIPPISLLRRLHPSLFQASLLSQLSDRMIPKVYK